jgi:hypothetical protein
MRSNEIFQFFYQSERYFKSNFSTIKMILKRLTDPEKKKDLMFNKIINIKCVNISFKFFVPVACL